MNQNSVKKIVEYIGSLFIVGIFLYFVLQPQTVTSCKSLFLEQTMTAAQVKDDCPNLTKQDLVEALIESKDLTKEEKDILLVDITENY